MVGADALTVQQIPFPRHIPFVEALGVQLWQFGGGTAELRLPVQPDQLKDRKSTRLNSSHT